MKRPSKFNSLVINERQLKRVDIASLSRLADALGTLADVSNGLLAQPCFFCEEAKEWTDAGDILERITNFLDTYRTQIVKVISDATPADEIESIEMVWARVRYEADLSADLPEFAQMVCQLAATYRGKAVR